MDKHHSRDWLVEFHQPLQWCCDLDHKHSGEIFFDEEEEYDQHFKEEHHDLQNESDVLKLRSKLRKIRPDYTCLICSMIPKNLEHVIPFLEGKVSSQSAAAGKARSPECARKDLIHHIGVHLKSFGLAYLAYFRDDAEGKSLNSKQGSIAADKDEMRYPVENDPDYLDEQFKDYQTPEEPSMDTVHEDWLFIDYLKGTDWSAADDTIYRHFDKHQPRPHESRYERTGDMADLEAAIRAVQQAINSTPEDHPDRAGKLNNLGNKLESRYKRTGGIADLEAAIQVAEQAVDSTPEDHPDRAGRLNNLGNKLDRRYDRTGDMADYEMSGTLFSTAWNCNNSIPFHRIQAAARAVTVLAQLGNLEQAAQLAHDVITLLPTVSIRSLHRTDQQYAISHFSRLAASACSILLRLHQPEQGLEMLEKGRTTILSQLIGDRSDISTLSEAYGQFESLLDQINAPLPSQDSEILLKQAQQQRRDSVAAFDSCVQEIRNIPGNERFLLGLTPAEMRACAPGGLIVVVNVTDLGSHAIIVSSSGIKSLELPKLFPGEARGWLGRRWSTGQEGFGSNNKNFRDYLAWLWQVCVRNPH